MARITRETLAERFLMKVAFAGRDECWEWLASRDIQGYGRFMVNRNPTTAQRVAYELFVGPIPRGARIDHLCRNHGCVNPTHLEAVSSRENTLRGIGITALNARKTHCVKGHPFDEGNTYRRKDRAGRHCKTCEAERRQANAPLAAR